jgi:hypothetical protein
MSFTPIDPNSVPDPDNPKSDTSSDISDPSLQARLQDYYRAIQSEFDTATNDGDSGDQEVYAEAVRKSLRQHMPTAVATIVNLSISAESENVRLNASKYIIEVGLDMDKGAGKSDPLADLVKQLTKQPANKIGTIK